MLQRFHCEHVLEELGGCGPYQRKLLVLILFPFGLIIAFQTSTLYNQLIPDHWCSVPEMKNFSYGEQQRLIRPKLISGSSISLYPEDNIEKPIVLSQCEMYDIDYRKAIAGLEITNNAIIHRPKPRKKIIKDRLIIKIVDEEEDDNENGNNKNNGPEKEDKEINLKKKLPSVIPTKVCSDGWVYNREQFRSSAAMQYNMVCENRNQWQTIEFYRSLSSVLFGSIHAFIGDRFGRKWCIFTILITNLLSSICPLVTTHYTVFIICQLFNASTHPIAILSLFVYGSEFMLPEWRSSVILLVCCSLYLGEWLAFLLAATLSDWIQITGINCITILFGFFILTFMNESPHWILSRTRNSERLQKCFEKINKINSGKLDEDSIKSIVNKFTHLSIPIDKNEREKRYEVKNDKDELSRMTKLCLFFKRSSMIQIVLLFAFVLGTNLLVTSEFQSRKKKFDETSLVMDSFFGSLIKMPAIVLTWIMIEQRIGRRWSNVTILIINFITIILMEFSRHFHFQEVFPIWTQITGTMFTLMLAECSIVILFLMILEMSPSRFRLLTLSLTYALGKLISIGLDMAFHSPSLQLILNQNLRRTILLLMLSLSVIIASFTAETRYEFLPIGLMAAEELMTNVHYWSMSKIKSDLAPSNLFLTLSKWDINSNHSIVQFPNQQTCKVEKLKNS